MKAPDKQEVPVFTSPQESSDSPLKEIKRGPQPNGLYVVVLVMGLEITMALVLVAITSFFRPPTENSTPEVFFSVTHNGSAIQHPGVAEVVFKFANIPSDFYVDKVVLRVSEVGFDIPISDNPSRQLIQVKVSKVVSAAELEMLPATILIDTEFVHEPSEPVAKLVVLLSYNEIQTQRRLLISPTFLDVSGSPIPLAVRPNAQWIEVPHILATEQ